MMSANPAIYLILVRRCQFIRRGVDVSSKGVNVTKGVSVYPYPKFIGIPWFPKYGALLPQLLPFVALVDLHARFIQESCDVRFKNNLSLTMSGFRSSYHDQTIERFLLPADWLHKGTLSTYRQEFVTVI